MLQLCSRAATIKTSIAAQAVRKINLRPNKEIYNYGN